MSRQNAREFLKELEKDPDFKHELQQCRSQEEFEKKLKGRGFTFTREDVKAVFEERLGHKLSEEELNRVASGSIGSGSEFFSWHGNNG